MKHADIIERMTIEEKAAILSGKGEWESRNIDRIGIPSIFCADGPHGIRKQAGAGDHLGLNKSLPSTCFPTAATVANSWDEKLGEAVGKALGEEASALGVDVLLGPGLNIKRSPLCGRNFEYFSEDPYLSGKMAAAYIRGIQSQGVFACPKHFAVNSQELRRMAMNSVIDERTLREIYLTGFEIAVKEGGAKAVMTSYNQVNGAYANENEHLLRDILRGEWGFDGIVITDWGGSNDHVKGVAAGSNLEMPNPGLDSAREIIRAVESGELSMEALDACVDDFLDAVIALKMSGSRDAQARTEIRAGAADQIESEEQAMAAAQARAAEQPEEQARPAAQTRAADQPEEQGNRGMERYAREHHELARRAAAESAVLLKNDNRLLPLKSGVKVAVVGDFAFAPRYQGAGSSMVNPTELETIESVFGEYDLEAVGFVRGYRRDRAKDEALKKAAVELAAAADVVLYFFGLDERSEAEGMDRAHMGVPENQIEVLRAVSKANANVVGVLSAGASIEMPWGVCCMSILHGYLGGQAGAGAVMDLITGKENPSGKLNETYPVCHEDTPARRYFPSAERNSEYRESVFVGYRYYATRRLQVQYPFGYGLSYTDFSYSGLEVREDGVSFTLENTGEFDGAEIAQLYVGCEGGMIFRPEKELKGFAKVFLKAGESRTVTIPFDDKTFRYWNTAENRWAVESGVYRISVGANVEDIRLSQTVEREGEDAALPYSRETVPSYYSGDVRDVPDKEYEAILGQPVPRGKWTGELGVNDALCQMTYAKSWLARQIGRRLTAMKEKSDKNGKPDLNVLFIYNMPFRGIAKMTEGAVSMEMARGMVDAANGHLFRGLKKIIGGYFANRKANREYEKKLNPEGR